MGFYEALRRVNTVKEAKEMGKSMVSLHYDFFRGRLCVNSERSEAIRHTYSKAKRKLGHFATTFRKTAPIPNFARRSDKDKKEKKHKTKKDKKDRKDKKTTKDEGVMPEKDKDRFHVRKGKKDKDKKEKKRDKKEKKDRRLKCRDAAHVAPVG